MDVKTASKMMSASKIAQIRADFKTVIDNASSKDEKEAMQEALRKFEDSLSKTNT